MFPLFHFVLLCFAVYIPISNRYFPALPRVAPSVSQEFQKTREFHVSEFFRNVFRSLRNWSLVAVTLSAGGLGGIFNAWSASLPVILGSKNLSNGALQWLGFASIAANLLGSLCAGWFSRFFHRRLKLLSLLLLGAALLSFVYFALQLEVRAHIGTFGTLVAASCLGAFFCGADVPVGFELAADLAFPETESTAVGLNVLVNNAVSVVFLAALASLSAATTNTVVCAVCAAGILLLLVSKESYPRLDQDEGSAVNPGDRQALLINQRADVYFVQIFIIIY